MFDGGEGEEKKKEETSAAQVNEFGIFFPFP
jgi:hypothetical protein